MDSGLGTSASTQPCSSSQMYNQCYKRRRKKWSRLGTKSSNQIVLLFWNPNTCWGPFDHNNLRPISFQETYFDFSLQKYIFYIYIGLSRWKNTSSNGPQPRNSTRFQQRILMQKGWGTIFMAAQDLMATFYRTKKIMICVIYVIFQISIRILGLFFFFFFFRITQKPLG